MFSQALTLITLTMMVTSADAATSQGRLGPPNPLQGFGSQTEGLILSAMAMISEDFVGRLEFGEDNQPLIFLRTTEDFELGAKLLSARQEAENAAVLALINSEQSGGKLSAIRNKIRSLKLTQAVARKSFDDEPAIVRPAGFRTAVDDFALKRPVDFEMSLPMRGRTIKRWGKHVDVYDVYYLPRSALLAYFQEVAFAVGWVSSEKGRDSFRVSVARALAEFRDAMPWGPEAGPAGSDVAVYWLSIS